MALSPTQKRTILKQHIEKWLAIGNATHESPHPQYDAGTYATYDEAYIDFWKLMNFAIDHELDDNATIFSNISLYIPLDRSINIKLFKEFPGNPRKRGAWIYDNSNRGVPRRWLTLFCQSPYFGETHSDRRGNILTTLIHELGHAEISTYYRHQLPMPFTVTTKLNEYEAYAKLTWLEKLVHEKVDLYESPLLLHKWVKLHDDLESSERGWYNSLHSNLTISIQELSHGNKYMDAVDMVRIYGYGRNDKWHEYVARFKSIVAIWPNMTDLTGLFKDNATVNNMFYPHTIEFLDKYLFGLSPDPSRYVDALPYGGS
jgi:hypothetical protein